MTEQIPLGKNTSYPKAFDASLLFPIDRSLARSQIGIGQTGQALPFTGYDEWTLYELCWLDGRGSPQMAVGLLRIPMDSVAIVESKSLKLYANSLYYRRFDSVDALSAQIVADLNRCLGTEVQFQIVNLGRGQGRSAGTDSDQYIDLDDICVNPGQSSDQSTDKHLLQATPSVGTKRYKTARFRSLCPVTGQPDWASVYIRIDDVDVSRESLAQYLAGFSEHQGFHENCVERIYLELQRELKPSQLSVAARYTRRGGIDINPIRASCTGVLDMPLRELRQ